MNADHQDREDHEDHGLATALRHRLEEVRPDLDRLVRVATRQGTRLRRRARLVVSLGAMAGVGAVAAAIAIGGSWAGAGSAGAGGSPIGFAGQPTSSSSLPTPSPTAPGPTAPSPSAMQTSEPAAPHTRRPPRAERSPVTLDLPGWTCTPPGDEKFVCSSHGDSVTVNWRPGSERAHWGSDPDKAADFISDVHGGAFVTVDASPETPSSEAVTVGHALVWTA